MHEIEKACHLLPAFAVDGHRSGGSHYSNRNVGQTRPSFIECLLINQKWPDDLVWVISQNLPVEVSQSDHKGKTPNPQAVRM